MSSGTIKINLLEKERARRRLDPQLLIMMLLVALSVVAAAAYTQALEQQLERERHQVSELEEQLKQMSASLPIVEERRAQVAAMEGRLKQLQRRLENPRQIASLLRDLSALLPLTTWAESIAVDPAAHRVTIQARVSSALPLGTTAGLMRALTRSPRFGEPELGQVSEQGAQAGLTLTIPYRDESGGGAPVPPGAGGGQARVDQGRATGGCREVHS